MQTLLKPENLGPKIQAELAPVEPVASVSDEVANLNRTATSLERFRAEAGKEDSPWTLKTDSCCTTVDLWSPSMRTRLFARGY